MSAAQGEEQAQDAERQRHEAEQRSRATLAGLSFENDNDPNWDKVWAKAMEEKGAEAVNLFIASAGLPFLLFNLMYICRGHVLRNSGAVVLVLDEVAHHLHGLRVPDDNHSQQSPLTFIVKML